MHKAALFYKIVNDGAFAGAESSSDAYCNHIVMLFFIPITAPLGNYCTTSTCALDYFMINKIRHPLLTDAGKKNLFLLTSV